MDHPFRNILLATEGTEFDSGSERVALEMVRRCNLPLSVVVPVVSNPEFEIEAQRLVDRAEHELAARIGGLRKIAEESGVAIDVRPRRGESPAGEIVREAEERKSDLIVIRRRGRRSFLANLMVGEMVTEVVASAPCSVLMVPRACGMWSRGILAAVSESDEKVIMTAASIAAACDLPLHVLCAASNERGRSEAERIVSNGMKIAGGLGAKAQGMVLVGKPCDAILSAPVDADLIVVGMGETHAGGTTQKVVGRSEKPVLAVHG